ncbi:hypothetical protein [Brevibacillus brevis]|uniref:CopG family transcriptional regulator n=1 Tax=Brevibacillus brevis TaxID=1393 RepID=A0ABY9TCR5_BREBE|nr:hypothetical protein [Brevibacillus brevis]WNC17887.1 hypothetical protein RGB73_30425 [Brevibacillus brevis]
MPRGGARPGAGRKPMGDKPLVSRSITLSLPEENWDALDDYLQRNDLDMAAHIRTLVMDDMLFNEDFHRKKFTKKKKT